VKVKCKIYIGRLGAPLKDKYGITVKRLTGQEIPGWDNPKQLPSDDALRGILYDFEYSKPEADDVIQQLAPLGSKYSSEDRMLDESVLERHGF
jgi:hypothetical protein